LLKKFVFSEKHHTFAIEFYADKGKTVADKQGTLNKPQIVPHKTEIITYLSILQIVLKSE
jgi:hypothetical protein